MTGFSLQPLTWSPCSALAPLHQASYIQKGGTRFPGQRILHVVGIPLSFLMGVLLLPSKLGSCSDLVETASQVGVPPSAHSPPLAPISPRAEAEVPASPGPCSPYLSHFLPGSLASLTQTCSHFRAFAFAVPFPQNSQPAGVHMAYFVLVLSGRCLNTSMSLRPSLTTHTQHTHPSSLACSCSPWWNSVTLQTFNAISYLSLICLFSCYWNGS